MHEAEVCSQLLEPCNRKAIAKNDVVEPYILTRQDFEGCCVRNRNQLPSDQ